jgi:hypothetical protein
MKNAIALIPVPRMIEDDHAACFSSFPDYQFYIYKRIISTKILRRHFEQEHRNQRWNSWTSI